MKILIVDDSVFAQRYTEKQILGKCPDAELIFASSGEEGYRQYKEQKPDYVITDLLMPGIGGQRMISMIREYDADSKIIVLSSDIQRAVKQEVEQLGIIMFLNKPLDEEKSIILANIFRGR